MSLDSVRPLGAIALGDGAGRRSSSFSQRSQGFLSRIVVPHDDGGTGACRQPQRAVALNITSQKVRPRFGSAKASPILQMQYGRSGSSRSARVATDKEPPGVRPYAATRLTDEARERCARGLVCLAAFARLLAQHVTERPGRGWIRP